MYNREKTDVFSTKIRYDCQRNAASAFFLFRIKFIFIERVKETNSKISGALLPAFETKRNNK